MRLQLRHRQRFNQEGVTLLLSILVLSSILAISFSLATILFVEVRSSGDLLRTETSYYGAQAITEQALYKLKRNVSETTQCDPALPKCYSGTIGSVDTGSNPPRENNIADPIQQDSIPPGGAIVTNDGYSSFNDKAKHYFLYDPANPTAGSGYSKITLTYLHTDNTTGLMLYLCQFNPGYSISHTTNGSTEVSAGTSAYATSPCSDANSSEYWLLKGIPFYPGNSPMTISLIPTMQQELVLYNPSTYGSSVYVQLQTFDNSPAQNPKGIPYFEQTAVDIDAQLGGVGRKLRVYIPNGGGK